MFSDFTPESATRWPSRYGLALAAVATAALTAMVASRLHAPSTVLVFIYLLAIMASAWLGGYGPGVLATVASGIVGPFLVNANLTIARLDLVRLALILVIALLISKIAASRAKAESALRQMNIVLDQKVRERTEELRRANDALREREFRLLRQADELQRSNTDLAHFAFVASHDMQEPLRMIGIYAELLDRRLSAGLDEESAQFVRNIVDGAGRLQRLLVDLLEYARVARRPPDKASRTNLKEPVGIAMDNLAHVIRETGAIVHVEDLPAVECDPVRMTQVFQNLLSNALKYRSEAPPEITIGAVRGNAEWTVTVRDNGVGIKPEYHHTVFEPFKRLHGPDIEGSGIGLAICRRIVERYGGTIWVESTEGQGTTIAFSVPEPLDSTANAASSGAH